MKIQSIPKTPALALSVLAMACLSANVSFANTNPSKADDSNLQAGEPMTECATISDNVARLACYDNVAQGLDPTPQKRAVDLTSTIKSTVAGNPQVVFSDGTVSELGTTANDTANANDDNANVANLTDTKTTDNKNTDDRQKSLAKLVGVNADNDTSSKTKLTSETLTNPKLTDKQSSNTLVSEWTDDNTKPDASDDSANGKKSLKSRLTALFNKDDYQDNMEDSTQGAVLTELGVSKEALQRYTPLSLAFDLDKNSERGLWTARPHYANYILPYYYNTKPNYNPTSPSLGSASFNEDELRKIEVKYQLSLKTKAAQNLFGTDADLWIGYTQQSHWQTYNENHSRPFRSHDYQPEVFLTQPVSADLPFDGKLRVLGVGGIHHSNGESDPVSRSWNRLYLTGGAEWGNLTVAPTMWIALPKREGSKESDNPDLTDYYGFGDVKFLYRLEQGKNVSGTLRLNPLTGKGAVQLDYVHPIGRGVSGYAQIFHGYGQNLIDYNHEATSFGFGVMLNDWLGL